MRPDFRGNKEERIGGNGTDGEMNPNQLPKTGDRSKPSPSSGTESDGSALPPKCSGLRRRFPKRERTALRQLSTHAKDEGDGIRDYFVDKEHSLCTSLILIVICCAFRVVFAGIVIYATASFQNGHLDVVNKAFKGAEIESTLLTTLNAIICGIYVLASIFILGDVFISSCAIFQKIRPMAFSLVVLHALGFLVMGVFIFVVALGYHKTEIASSMIGNVGFNKSQDDAEFLKTMGVIQQGLKCCGFKNGTVDWIRSVMIEWNEPLSEEWRRIQNKYTWQYDCDKGYVCVAPKTCCSNPSEGCNNATISVKDYDQIKMQNFGALEQHLHPEKEDEIFSDGCVTVFASSIDTWAFLTKIGAVVILVFWIILTVILVLTVAQVDGLGKVQTKHKRIDPLANSNLLPYAHRLDRVLPFTKRGFGTTEEGHGRARLGNEVKTARRRKRSSSSDSLGFRFPKLPSYLVESSSVMSLGWKKKDSPML